MANNSCLQKGRKAKYGRNSGTQGKQRTTKSSFFGCIIIKSKKKEGDGQLPKEDSATEIDNKEKQRS